MQDGIEGPFLRNILLRALSIFFLPIEALTLVRYPFQALFSNLPSEKAVYLSMCLG